MIERVSEAALGALLALLLRAMGFSFGVGDALAAEAVLVVAGALAHRVKRRAGLAQPPIAPARKRVMLFFLAIGHIAQLELAVAAAFDAES